LYALLALLDGGVRCPARIKIKTRRPQGGKAHRHDCATPAAQRNAHRDQTSIFEPPRISLSSPRCLVNVLCHFARLRLLGSRDQGSSRSNYSHRAELDKVKCEAKSKSGIKFNGRSTPRVRRCRCRVRRTQIMQSKHGSFRQLLHRASGCSRLQPLTKNWRNRYCRSINRNRVGYKVRKGWFFNR
jgi:hypothetical protein